MDTLSSHTHHQSNLSIFESFFHLTRFITHSVVVRSTRLHDEQGLPQGDSRWQEEVVQKQWSNSYHCTMLSWTLCQSTLSPSQKGCWIHVVLSWCFAKWDGSWKGILLQHYQHASPRVYEEGTHSCQQQEEWDQGGIEPSKRDGDLWWVVVTIELRSIHFM